jgi:hypothetical protein
MAFTATPPSPEPAPRWTPSTSGTARECRYQPKDSGNTKIYGLGHLREDRLDEF